MNETQLCTIEQIEQFLSGSASIEFSTAGNDSERYAHISRVLKRFDSSDFSLPLLLAISIEPFAVCFFMGTERDFETSCHCASWKGALKDGFMPKDSAR